MEIERKFLVPDIFKIDINLDECKRKTIKQDYLYVDSLTAIRKRLIIDDNVSKYVYTVKTMKTGYSVNELESELDSETYYSLKTNNNYNEISKTRYFIPYMDYVIELDIFSGPYKGLIFAEIEFKSEEEARKFDSYIPKWFGCEISNFITNSDMAITPVKKVLESIQNIKNKEE